MDEDYGIISAKILAGSKFWDTYRSNMKLGACLTVQFQNYASQMRQLPQNRRIL